MEPEEARDSGRTLEVNHLDGLLVHSSLASSVRPPFTTFPRSFQSHPQGEGNEVTGRTRSGRTGTVSDRTPEGVTRERG